MVFFPQDDSDSEVQNKGTQLQAKDLEARYWSQFYSKRQNDTYFNQLRSGIAWRSERLKIFGRWVDQPRLVAWYGDPGLNYTYSGLRLEPSPWSQTLLTIKEEMESALRLNFNSCLLNLYRNERDSNGWHSDDEKELGSKPIIASLSFGATRDFLMRHKIDKNEKVKLPLEAGSLLVMTGKTQELWQHSLPKRTRPHGERINLTFRTILT